MKQTRKSAASISLNKLDKKAQDKIKGGKKKGGDDGGGEQF